jgi:hypothetical protein
MRREKALVFRGVSHALFKRENGSMVVRQTDRRTEDANIACTGLAEVTGANQEHGRKGIETETPQMAPTIKL